MTRVLSILLCTALLASCTATQRPTHQDYNSGHKSHAEWMDAHRSGPTIMNAKTMDSSQEQTKLDAAIAKDSAEQSRFGGPLNRTPATTTTQDTIGPRMNAAEIAHANALIQRGPTPPASKVSGWDVLGTIVAIPLLLPIAMLANYPGPGVHCRSYIYKDQYHAKCY